MDENLDALRKEVRDLTEQTSKVLYYMHSDPSTKRKGLVEKLDIMEEILNDLIVREKIMKAKATVYGSIGSIIITIIWQLVSKYLIPNFK